MNYEGRLSIGNTFTEYAPTVKVDKDSREITPVTRSHVLPTNEFFTRLNQRLNASYRTGNSGNIEILPQNTRITYKSPSTGFEVFVVEEPPSIRTISVSKSFAAEIENLKKTGKEKLYKVAEAKKNVNRNDNSAIQFNLSFPYIVYMISSSNSSRGSLAGTRVFYRNAPIRSISDPLYLVNLTNVNGTGVCLGSNHMSTRITNAYEMISNVVERFWVNIFNTDYINNYLSYAKRVPELSDFFTWQYNTTIDPMFILGVDWETAGSTVGQSIKNMACEGREGYIHRDAAFVNMSQLVGALSATVQTGEFDGKTATALEILDNLTDSSYLKDNITLRVGDSVYWKSKLHTVMSFMGVNGDYPSRVRLLNNETDEIITVTDITSSAIKNDLFKGVMKFRQDTVVPLPNGMSFSHGDLLKIESDYYGTIYRRVADIRVALDKNIEIKIGNEWYLMGEASKLEKVDKLTINGVTLEAGKKYRMLDKIDSHIMPVSTVQHAEFVELDVGRNGSIVGKFSYGPNSRVKAMEINDTIPFLTDDDEVDSSVSLIRANGFLHTNKAGLGYKLGVAAGKSLVCEMDKTFEYDSYRTNFIRFDPTVAANELSKMKNRVFIPGSDFDIDISVGDHVIFPDWNNPAEFRNIRTVTGFKMLAGNTSFCVFATDGKTELSYQLIDMLTGKIDTIGIRKVAHQVGDICVGDYIRAKVPQITHFPKKDTFRISAIIIDTGNAPLILCSNLCTIWLDSTLADNFEILPANTPSIRDTTDSFDYSSIKIQAGDMCLCRETRSSNAVYFGYYVDSGTRSSALMEATAREIRRPYYANITPYGVRLPRHKMKDLKDARKVSASVGHHGRCTHKAYSNIAIPSMKGVFDNV